MKKIIGIILFVLFSGVSYLLTFIDINKFENVYDIAFTYLSITIGGASDYCVETGLRSSPPK